VQRISNFNQSTESPPDQEDDSVSVTLSDEMSKYETYSAQSLQTDIEMFAYNINPNSRSRVSQWLTIAKQKGIDIESIQAKINNLNDSVSEEDIAEMARLIMVNEVSTIAKELQFSTPIPVRKGRSRVNSRASLSSVPEIPEDFMADEIPVRTLHSVVQELSGLDTPQVPSSAPPRSRSRFDKKPRKALTAQTPSKKGKMPLAWLNDFRANVKKRGSESFVASQQKNRDLLKRLIAELGASAPKGYPTGSWGKLMRNHESIKSDNGEVFTWDEAQRDPYFRKFMDTMQGMQDQLEQLQ
jgi:hypothetical protein